MDLRIPRILKVSVKKWYTLLSDIAVYSKIYHFFTENLRIRGILRSIVNPKSSKANPIGFERFRRSDSS